MKNRAKTLWAKVELCKKCFFYSCNNTIFLRFCSGCRSTSTGEPLATDCNACFYFKRVDTGECVKTCPEGFKERDATCVPSKLV